MTSQQIEYFLVVARNRSFTKAASELFTTQPAVSRHISSLEAELGFSLFDRTSRKTQLTPIGELFYSFFSDFKSELNNVIQRANSLVNTQVGEIKLGLLSGWDLSQFLPSVLANFADRYPNIKIRLENHDAKALAVALKEGKIDIALSMSVIAQSLRNVAVQPLALTPRMLIFSVQHPNAKKKSLTVEDFKDEVFFVASDDEHAQEVQFVREYCRPYHFEPKIQITPNTESTFTNVQNNLGVAIMGSWNRAQNDYHFHAISLDSCHEISLIWNYGNKNVALPLFVNEFTLLFQTETLDAN